MIVTRDEFTTLEQFICDHSGDELAEHAIGAWQVYRNDNEQTDTYAVIRVKGYYAVTKIIDEWQPIEVSTYVQPFDKERVYPLQKVKKIIDWEY